MFAARIAAAVVALFGWAASNDALSQTPSGSNYRTLAVCEEVLVEGRWFSTFGEGRCPPGSRRTTAPRPSQRGGDVNSQNMRRMQGQVQALADAQESILAAGRAIQERYQAESDERAITYAYHLTGDVEPVAPASLYAPREFLFPSQGGLVHAFAGDPILTASDGFYSQCFVPLEDGLATQFPGHRHTVRSGELTCKLEERDRAYTPLYANYAASGGTEMSMGQTLEMKDDLYTICYRSMGMNAMCIRRIAPDKIVETTGIVELVRSSRSAALFEGVRDGQLQVRLVPNSSGQMPELMSFDLSASRVVQLLGATFEVLEFGEGEIVMVRK
jgi:hypothetical protein